MKDRIVLLLLLTLISFIPVLAQSPTPSPSPQKKAGGSDEVVRTTTNLVQLDVVVTDKEGKPVTDLQPQDFEITEDKGKQQITNFSYIILGPSVTISPPAAGSKKTEAPVAPAPVR